MSKEREVHAEKKNTSWINPFVEFKLRMSEVNKINELVDKSIPLPVLKDGYDAWDRNERRYACPICECRVYEDYKYCKECGQKLDQENYAF